MRKRRHYTPEQKAAVLRRHLADKVPVSDLCDELKLQPSVFYQWLKQLLENAPVALAGTPRNAEQTQRKLEQRVAALEDKLAKKDGVIAEVTEEFVRLKKELGEP